MTNEARATANINNDSGDGNFMFVLIFSNCFFSKNTFKFR